MTTLAALVQDTWDLIYGIGGFELPHEDRTDSTITAVAVDLSTPLATPAMWHRDDIMEFTEDGELVYVVTDGLTSVNRAWGGTTAAAKTSGNRVIQNPDFPQVRVEKAIRQVIRVDLWPDVWSWHQDTFTFALGDHLYPLDQYVEEVAIVYQFNLNADNHMHWLPTGWWDNERQVDTTLAINKNLFRILRVFDPDETVFYTAKRRPHVDDLTNLSSEIADLIPWGAAAKLLAGRSAQSKRDSTRSKTEGGNVFQIDYEGFMGEFLRMRRELHDLLIDEVRPDMRYRPMERSSRNWA